MVRLAAAAVVAAAAAASAPAQTVARSADVRQSQEARSAEELPAYRIGPEDELLVSVWNNDAVTRTVPVRPDGRISLPLLNDVQAAGLTPMELRAQIVRRLSEYIPNPEVSVIVNEVKSFKVSVIGAVAKPGRYELKSWATVMDVLAMAGGFTEFAGRSKITVLRANGQRTQSYPFDYDNVSSNGGQGNFQLRPGDIVVVPGPPGVVRSN
jgi:polysaccharide export outer membrane protein